MNFQRAVLIGLLALLPTLGHAGEDAAPPAEAPQAKGFSGQVQILLSYAKSFNGINYRFGGTSPETGFDCSGFVGYVYKQVAGMNLPRNALAISQVGQKIAPAELRPGDLVFFNTLRRTISHVGIYLGDNRFIHATSSRTGEVMISDLRDRYWTRTFTSARRLDLPLATSEAAPE